jgi:hypothetical protein
MQITITLSENDEYVITGFDGSVFTERFIEPAIVVVRQQLRSVNDSKKEILTTVFDEIKKAPGDRKPIPNLRDVMLRRIREANVPRKADK